jgi:hypothetical protein
MVGMRRTVPLLASMALAMLALSGTALALPSERPDNTPEVDGRVRTIEQVGTNVWVGGNFSKVRQPKGPEVAVSNVAVFNSVTNHYVPIAPKLGDKSSTVWDMAPYGSTGNVLIAGKFPGPSSKEGNLLLVDGKSGKVLRWYEEPPELRSVLAAAGRGMVYGGGRSLSGFEFATGKKLWTRAKTGVNKSLHPNDLSPSYHDLILDASGKAIWAACTCDAVNGNPAKALVRLTDRGVHDASWVAKAGAGAFGHSVVEANGALYLGAGGSDFLAEFSKKSGNPIWVRDTSGSTQGVAVMGGQLVIGGHFWEVADQAGDKCGSGRVSSAPRRLDPNDECRTRKGIAAYSFDGRLDPNWAPEYSGGYHLVWTLHVEGPRLHTGGQFKQVSGVPQNSYARLSPSPS